MLVFPMYDRILKIFWLWAIYLWHKIFSICSNIFWINTDKKCSLSYKAWKLNTRSSYKLLWWTFKYFTDTYKHDFFKLILSSNVDTIHQNHDNLQINLQFKINKKFNFNRLGLSLKFLDRRYILYLKYFILIYHL